jgi:rhodanese-related sulfurtransferase
MSTNTISLDSFGDLLKSDRPLTIWDVRTPAEFAAVHVARARSMPLDQLDPAAVSAGRSTCDEPIYVICQYGARGASAAERLAAAGIAPVFNIEGGTSAWEKAGLPVERSGGKVISLERQVRIAAGSLVLIGLVLAKLIHPAFAGLCAFVGAGLVFAGVTDYCGMGMLLAKMPWNL